MLNLIYTEWMALSRSFIPPILLLWWGLVATLIMLTAWPLHLPIWPSILTTWVFLALPLLTIDPIRRMTSPDFTHYRLSAYPSWQLILAFFFAHWMAIMLLLQPLMGILWLDAAPIWVIQITLGGILALSMGVAILMGSLIRSTVRATMGAMAILLVLWIWNVIGINIPGLFWREWGILTHLQLPQLQTLSIHDLCYWVGGTGMTLIGAYLAFSHRRDASPLLTATAWIMMGFISILISLPSHHFPLWMAGQLPPISTHPDTRIRLYATAGSLDEAAATLVKQAIVGGKGGVLDPDFSVESFSDSQHIDTPPIQSGDVLVQHPSTPPQLVRLPPDLRGNPQWWQLAVLTLLTPPHAGWVSWGSSSPPPPVLDAFHTLSGGQWLPTASHRVSPPAIWSETAMAQLKEWVTLGGYWTVILTPDSPLPSALSDWGLTPVGGILCPHSSQDGACVAQSNQGPSGVVFNRPLGLKVDADSPFKVVAWTRTLAWPSRIHHHRSPTPMGVPKRFPLVLQASIGKGRVRVIAGDTWISSLSPTHPSARLWWWVIDSPLATMEPTPSMTPPPRWWGALMIVCGILGGLLCWGFLLPNRLFQNRPLQPPVP